MPSMYSIVCAADARSVCDS